ncbi:MAG: PAS domain S-box protein, partial [Caldithrix sp.]
MKQKSIAYRMERKQVVEELRLHKEILENMSEGVYLIRTSDGVIVYTNPRFEQLFGYEPKEMIGKHVSIVNAPGEKSPEEVAKEIIKSLNETKTWSGEVHNIKKDGIKFRCSANVSTFEHSRYGTVWISVHEDITERKHAEEALQKAHAELEIKVKERTAELSKVNKELKAQITGRKRVETALRESEERFRTLYTKTPAMLHSINANSRLIDVSDHWLAVLGYERDEVIGRKVVEFLTEESRRYAETVIIPEFLKVGYVDSIPYQFVKKSGEIVDIELSAIAVLDKEGNYVRSLAVLADVTEGKRAQESLRENEQRFRKIFEEGPLGMA